MYVEGKQSVLIIGGGIFGLSTALSLLSSGHSVTVFDKSPLPAIDAASTDISKVIRLDYGHSKIYTTLAYLSILQWLEWNKQTKDVLGDETKLFDQCGGVFANKGIGEFEFAKHTFQCLESLGISNDISAPENFQNGAFVNLSVNQHNRQIHQQTLQSRFPKWSNPILNSSLSGYVQPTAGWANAELSMKFVIEKLKRLGCKFVTGSPAGCFDSFIHSSTSSSTVIGIRTADGHSHFGDKILVACGAWTASVLPEIDPIIRAHMMPVMHFRIPTSKKEEWEGKNFPVWLVNDEENDTLIYGFPVNDSSLLKIAIDNSGYINPASPNHPLSSSPPRPSSTPYTILDNPTPVLPSKSISYFLSFLADTFPEVLQFDVANVRMCWYCNSIDYGFIIDEVPGKENVWVATGGSGHGFKFFPVLGSIIHSLLFSKHFSSSPSDLAPPIANLFTSLPASLLPIMNLEYLQSQFQWREVSTNKSTNSIMPHKKGSESANIKEDKAVNPKQGDELVHSSKPDVLFEMEMMNLEQINEAVRRVRMELKVAESKKRNNPKSRL